MSHTSRLPLFRGASSGPLDRVARVISDGWQAVGLELRRRQAIAALDEADDRMLADIGIARGDIEAAVLRGRR